MANRFLDFLDSLPDVDTDTIGMDHRLDKLEATQRERDEELRQNAVLAPDYQMHIQNLTRRIDRLELTVETLVEVLLIKGMVDHKELEVLMNQVDLRDGVENGRVNPERRNSHVCPACAKYANPERAACVYCGCETAPVKPTKEVATITCVTCKEQVPETQAYFTGRRAGVRPLLHALTVHTRSTCPPFQMSTRRLQRSRRVFRVPRPVPHRHRRHLHGRHRASIPRA